MEYSNLTLNDLPDELLLTIFEKLNNVSVLYSLTGVNRRLNDIVHGPSFTNHLTLLRCFRDYSIHPLRNRILSQFCSQILPDIRHTIKWLNLEPKSIEHILGPTIYPVLTGLGLYCNETEKLLTVFNKGTIFNNTIKTKILSLVIHIYDTIKQNSSEHLNTIIFTKILETFSNLQCLNYGHSSISYKRITFNMKSPTFLSSTLLELHVCVNDFNDCLYLLDGRFNQLRAFYIDVDHILSTTSNINTKEKLINLKSFSLHCDTRTHVYDEAILPLLQRMLNLEKLDLDLKLDRYTGFIDGNHLKENLISYMPKLNQFTFNICLFNHCPYQICVPSNEDFQHTFENLLGTQVVSCVDYFEQSNYSYFHFYTYPYQLKLYENITNNFSGGLFKYVHTISLHDERPFEHEFFLRIAQSFPLLANLTIINYTPQKHTKLTNNNENLAIIQYPHLDVLNLLEAHDDYVEQFLVESQLHLSNYIYLCARYESLKLVTNNFTRDATRINCAKVAYVCLDDDILFPKNFKNYFLSANVTM